MATWLTLGEAANHLKLAKSTLYRLAQAGEIPAPKMGRICRSDLEETDKWLKGSGGNTTTTSRKQG